MTRAFAFAVMLSACGGARGAATAAPTTPAPTAATGDKVFTPAEIADHALPSVVLVQTPTMIGTGFVVWQDGRVATNLHVIAGAKEASILLNDGRKFEQVEVLAVDQAHDLAILRIPTTGLKALALGDSTAVKPGQHVVAIGHPMGMGNTVSDGLVSAVRKIDPKLTLLQISVPISPGSSGGPIFNEHGEVIGIATLYSAEGQNLNFGMPIQYLKPMLLAERGTPLSAFASELDAALFEGCSIDEVKVSVTEIEAAIKTGARLFNNGDAKACYDLYEKASLKIVGALKSCPGVRETLLGGLSNANKGQDPREKAWAVRHAFDRILGAFEAAMNNAEKQEKQEQQKHK
jgi:serine protease Do